MIHECLALVVDKLKADEPLANYFGLHYPGKPPYFLIGLKPDMDNGTAVPTDLFPFVALAFDQETREGLHSKYRELRMSLLYGVYDDRLENGVFQGFKAICDLSEIILNAIRINPVGSNSNMVVNWDGTATVQTDSGMLEPFYQGEISLTLKARLN